MLTQLNEIAVITVLQWWPRKAMLRKVVKENFLNFFVLISNFIKTFHSILSFKLVYSNIQIFKHYYSNLDY